MKLSSAIVFLVSIASSAALKPSTSIMRNARRVDGNARQLDQNQQEDEYAFLQKYSLKMIQCKTGEPYVNAENGETEYSTVVFRLCASCDSDAKYGCKESYGDYVVGLNSFVSEYLEQKREEMQNDDQNNWKMEEFGECKEYEADKDAQQDEDAAYYVGPACTEDGTGVKIAMFGDYTCQTESETTFEEISNGVSLPYSTGGLIGDGCESCYGVNDKGEYEQAEMCTNLYMWSGKCESKMEEGSYHYAGKIEESCEYVESLMPRAAKRSGGGAKAFGWVLLVLVVAGAAAYGFVTMKKKQDEKRQGLMS